MVVSSYLEAFLTVYAWQTYYILYLMFAATGMFLYPFLRIINDIYISYVSGSEYAGTNYLRQLLANVFMAALVFWLALMPFKSIDLSSATVKSVCTEKKDTLKFTTGTAYFNNGKTRVPIMPWLAMAIGHGINSVIYDQTPCTLDITEASKAVMGVDLSEADNPALLNEEINHFVGSCHMRATTLFQDMLNNKYGENVAIKARNIMKDTLEDVRTNNPEGIRDRKKLEQYLRYNYDSVLLKKLFYQSNSPLDVPELKGMLPLEADKAVVGVNGYQKNGSKQQGKATPPSCLEWWEGSGKLRYRMVAAMKKKLAINMANDLGVSSCQNDYPFYMTDRRKAMCVNKITEDLYKGNADNLTSAMFRSIQGPPKKDSVLSDSEAGKLGTLAAVGVGSSILSIVTGKDLSIGIIGQATSLYITLFILKLMLKYFLPMILMSIYMFWGVYMTVGEFRGGTMVKGMFLIIALTVMPGLWAIVEHLDDSLYSSMYSDGDSDDMLKFNMLLLDITTGMFQVAIVFVVFFLIGEAGGGNAKAAVNDAQNMGNNAARGAGNAAGNKLAGMGQSGAGAFGRWGKRTVGNIKQKLTPYRVTQPGSGRK